MRTWAPDALNILKMAPRQTVALLTLARLHQRGIEDDVFDAELITLADATLELMRENLMNTWPEGGATLLEGAETENRDFIIRSALSQPVELLPRESEHSWFYDDTPPQGWGAEVWEEFQMYLERLNHQQLTLLWFVSYYRDGQDDDAWRAIMDEIEPLQAVAPLAMAREDVFELHLTLPNNTA